jgi:hypothetical protein
MRIRIIELDATPEEVARSPEMQHLLRQRPFAPPASADGTEGGDAGPATALPAPVAELLVARGPGGVVLEKLNEFLGRIITWEGVDARVGVSRLNRLPANVIRLHRRGSGVGAFVYIELPAVSLKFRLPRNHSLEGFSHARAREVKPGVPYGIAMRLTATSLSEALKLARHAYEHAEGGSSGVVALPAAIPKPAAASPSPIASQRSAAPRSGRKRGRPAT